MNTHPDFPKNATPARPENGPAGASASRPGCPADGRPAAPAPMPFAEFQSLAQMATLGALSGAEWARFHEGRRYFGPEAERVLEECRTLASALALGLPAGECPPPSPLVKARLLAEIAAQGKAAAHPKTGAAQGGDRARQKRGAKKAIAEDKPRSLRGRAECSPRRLPRSGPSVYPLGSLPWKPEYRSTAWNW